MLTQPAKDYDGCILENTRTVPSYGSNGQTVLVARTFPLTKQPVNLNGHVVHPRSALLLNRFRICKRYKDVNVIWHYEKISHAMSLSIEKQQ